MPAQPTVETIYDDEDGGEMRRGQFEKRLRDLMAVPVDGWTDADKAAAVGRHVDAFLADHGSTRFAVRFEPFVPGRRPDDEGSYPGLGSSEQLGLFNPSRSAGDHVKLLLRCYADGALADDLPHGARAWATIEAIDDAGECLGAVEGWSRREVTTSLEPAGGRPTQPADGSPPALVLDLDVNEVFASTDPDLLETYFGFGSLFFQRVRVSIDIDIDGVRIAGDELTVEIYNESKFGSLYERLITVLLKQDTASQLHAIGARDRGGVEVAHHPWYPVLRIGMEKSRLYMAAIAADLVDQKRALTDPGWLLRVGLYLEFLTCLGVAETVRDSFDLLTSEERAQFETAAEHDEIRSRIDVAAWKPVWRMREMCIGRKGTSSAANLLRKRHATFAFLHAHHEDLKHAIELAGPNLHNAQETWHRVFRDAERAVLQVNQDAFPELLELPPVAREFALWHQCGTVGRLHLMPRQLTELFGDQDGVFPSACRQYRASMNQVAAWALGRGLMEYTGSECIPASASLLEAHISKRSARLARLQGRDGFAPELDVHHEAPDDVIIDRQAVLDSLYGVELFTALTVDELSVLADRARPIALDHLQRIIIQGREGSSLFILHDGTLEVIARNADHERRLALLNPPAVVGELSFLLDEPRTATVRAIQPAVVLEIGAATLRPLVEARPALLDALTALLEERRRANAEPVSAAGLCDRVRRVIFAAATGLATGGPEWVFAPA